MQSEHFAQAEVFSCFHHSIVTVAAVSTTDYRRIAHNAIDPWLVRLRLPLSTKRQKSWTIGQWGGNQISNPQFQTQKL